jgi:hypothetical protein
MRGGQHDRSACRPSLRDIGFAIAQALLADGRNRGPIPRKHYAIPPAPGSTRNADGCRNEARVIAAYVSAAMPAAQRRQGLLRDASAVMAASLQPDIRVSVPDRKQKSD